MVFQLPRRAFLQSAAASAIILPSIAARAIETPQAVAIDKTILTTMDKVVHTTVLLSSQIDHNSVQFGTGFIFSFLKGTKKIFPAIVTNKHVINGMRDCQFELTARNADWTPKLSSHLPVTIPSVTQRSIGHPDPAIDLAIIPIWDVINTLEAEKDKPFFVTIDASILPDANTMSALTPLEEVITAGYPGGVRDTVNNLPVLHRGVTATPAYLDFMGQKQFLIDIAMWPGASGSPVLLYNEGTLFNPRGNNVSFGERLILLGVARQVVEQDIDWKLRGKAPSTTKPEDVPQVPTNLGVCIKSASILDFEDELLRLGIPKPDGYTKRDLG